MARSTVLRLSWHPAEPLAVTLTVDSQPEHPSLPRGRWSVLRDFLRYGLDAPTGDGDVRIRPERDGVRLDLLRGSRPCSLRVPAAWLAGFLDATERAVPAGEERSDAALDELIQRLLDQGGPG